MPEGHSFACAGEAAVDGVSETRSHAVGQSLDKRTLLRVGRGHSVGLYAPLHMTGLLGDRSINRATAVGRESPEPTPAFSVLTVCFVRCHSVLSARSPSLEARSP